MDNSKAHHVSVRRVTPTYGKQQTNDYATTRSSDGIYHVYRTPHDIVLGTTATSQKVRVTDETRQSGMYVLGIQGRGKSSLLEQIIYQDICRGNAVLVLDPHGDLIDHCIAQLPANRLKDTYLLDMEDEHYPFGVNLFTAKKQATAIAQTQAVDRVMHVFEAVWGDVLKQQNLPRYLRAAILTLLQNPGTTLVDMYPFLLQEEYRQKLLRSVKDPSIKQFWQYQYDDLTPAARKRETAPLVNRLEALFMGRTLISNILGQSHTTVNFRAAIENKEILFIKLPIQTLPQDASLIGTMLIAQIHAAIFSFKDVPLAKRPSYSIFIDEFQNFVTSDIEEIFTQGRKFGSRLCVAHQIREQLPRYLAKTTIGAQTIICFQTTHDDASDMAPLFAGMEHKATDFAIDPLAHLDDYPNTTVKEFWRDYIEKLEKVAGTRVKWTSKPAYIRAYDFISKPIYPYLDFGYGSLKVQPSQATEILDRLNILIYESEKHGQINEPLHRKVAEETLPLFKEDIYGALSSTPQEQIGHATFTRRLSEVLTILIAQPITADSPTLSTGDVAHQLQRLEQRHAYVKRGAEIFDMQKTLDIPARVQAQEENRRREQIQKQTRAKYCRPSQEVEWEIRQRLGENEEDEEAPLQTWETAAQETPTQKTRTTNTNKKKPEKWTPFEDE